jgi:6-phosphogluconolactonase (cycloisomerase 2 family)
MLALVLFGAPAFGQPGTTQPLGLQDVPNMNQQITPLALDGWRFVTMNPDLADLPNWQAGQGVSSVVSPDHTTLLVLTSGFNRVYMATNPGPYPWFSPDSNEYVFVYDISTPTPAKKQVIQVKDSYHGIVFDPSGAAFYVAGGVDDNLHIFTVNASGTWAESAESPLALGNDGRGVGLNIQPNGALHVNQMVGVQPCAAGVAVSKDGQTLAIANYYNDSLAVFTGGLGNWSRLIKNSPTPNIDLRPGKNDPSKAGVPGGEFPFWVVLKGSGSSTTAYVSSIRDRQIVVVDLGGLTPSVKAWIPVKGQPNKMTLNADQSLLYVAEDQTDTVDIIDTTANAVVNTIQVIAPLLPPRLANYRGANTNSATLSPDETQLYVTNGNLNCISVIALGGANGGHAIGFIPTGWYPNSVSFNWYPTSKTFDSSKATAVNVYTVNEKSPTGANRQFCYGGYAPATWPNCMPTNEYNPERTKAGLQTFPLPSEAQLVTLTAQVGVNDRFSSTESANDAAVMAAVRKGIQHVIYILKENRTYDQILGDLGVGDGDPSLTEFGEAITPNEHNLARTFVTLDNFLDTAEVSYDGWLWSTSAQAPDVVEHQYPVAYADRGLSLESEGYNRNVNVGIPTLAGRIAADPFTSSDPDVLPGQTDESAPDGPDNELNGGYLWDAALRAHLAVRNYGFFIDLTRYSTVDYAIPLVKDPASGRTRTTVAYPTNAALAPYTDLFFRGFDNSFPDYYRFKEWEREFDSSYAKPERGQLPALSLVRFMHDHTGNYTPSSVDGLSTPEVQVADNDYAVGLLIQKIANSVYANNTLIFVVEDDAQDGGDHVDSHRSIAFVAGAYVKQKTVVSTRYNTLDFLRTMEEVLGLPPMNLHDALARPMADVFNTEPSKWSFTAVPSPYLYGTQLPLPPKPTGVIVRRPKHGPNYWARATKGMDFTSEDRVDPAAYNRILWKGIMGDQPYSGGPTGLDLRQNREELLAKYRQSLKQAAAKKVLKSSN